ncbi:MAG: response regulator [Spirochaetaceae bacterium]|jgi:CheY-like chemotaxis protein|nr:response regulator [Spirochaetaceae bacterium]
MKLKKILIVDDSRTARMMIIQSLMDQGLDRSLFIEAENGLAAVDIIKREFFDLIITDLLMPKMDGNTFIRKARLFPQNKETPIIILTSLGKEGVDKDILKETGIYLLQKPLSEDELGKLLGEIYEP